MGTMTWRRLGLGLLALGFGAQLQAGLVLSDRGDGLDRSVTVESTGQFRLVFEAGDNWGISHWYDLVHDQGGVTNLAASDMKDPGVREAGLFQMVWRGTVPDDPKLYMWAARNYHPEAQRSFSILVSSPSNVVVRTVSHPLLAAGVVTNLVLDVVYDIHPDGRILVTSKATALEKLPLEEWRCAVIGLCDPTQEGVSGKRDTQGWIRSSATQDPYDWSGKLEPYLYAYWSRATPAPYSGWTQASILLVRDPRNPHVSDQRRHEWTHFKRWFFADWKPAMQAGESITQNYMIQLGTTGSSLLPDLSDHAVAERVAKAYLASSTSR